MKLKIFSKEEQAYGVFNGGEIVENKPLGFLQDGGQLKPYSNIFYWANAEAKKDSTIGLHPHQGFEILSFILEGSIRHFDTKIDKWKSLSAGDVQIIQAGNGISHAEHMNSGSRMFQIWMDPNLSKTLNQEARYADYSADSFESRAEDGYEQIIYSGPKGKFELQAESIEFGRVKSNGKVFDFEVQEDVMLSIYVLNGVLEVDQKLASADDFVLIEFVENTIRMAGKAEWFYIKSPRRPSHATYAEIMQKRREKQR